MPRNFPIILAVIALGLVFFSAGHKSEANDATRTSEPNLSAHHAKARRAQLAGTVNYKIHVDLEQPDETYTGAVTIVAKLLHNSNDLTLDFTGGSVKTVTVNGTSISNAKLKSIYNGYFIALPKETLKVGDNTVLVEFSHKYSKTGNGLYRFVDPVDGRIYTYSNFEPYYANMLFPSFDQPDIKGRFQLTVGAPEKWQVVSALRERSVTKTPDHRKVWTFPETKPISTYIFSLHAGDYHVWDGGKTAEGIPLRLFARRSLQQYVDHKGWFKITRQGFEYFNRYFGHKYPFEKYDQLVVPDFNWGAMENVGAVTFTEHFAPRSNPTYEARMQHANTILHEMAHMWFGNLVTMQWWNDLWLNESFATYMANLALVEATEFKQAWDVFHKRTKQWAYWEDSLVTRHPITTEVVNTDQAFANFDGITYGKGASTLKQLAFLIGGDNFKEGMRLYFRNHAFANTQLSDFMAALSETSKIDLKPFTEEWLKTSGTNRVHSEHTCKDGKITDFKIIQSAPPDAPTLRTHRTMIALYDAQEATLTPTKIAPVTYSGKETHISELKGARCPDLINLNYDDHDFAKQTLSSKSLETVETSLSRMNRKLDRMAVWVALWDMVELTELDVYEYDTLARAHIDNEQNDQLIDLVLSSLIGRHGRHAALHYMPDQTKEARAKFQDAVQFWEQKIWDRLVAAPPGSDAKNIWFDFFVRIANSQKNQQHLASWLQTDKKYHGMKLDQDRRWSAVTRLSQLNFTRAGELRAAEAKRDSSSIGQRMLLRSSAIQPDLKIKRNYFRQITSTKEGDSLADQRAIMSGLFPVDQESLHRKFADEFFNRLPNLVKKKDAHFVEAFIDHLIPTFCSQSSIENLRKFIGYNSTLPAHASKPLKVALQMDERCYQVRTNALTSLKTGAE